MEGKYCMFMGTQLNIIHGSKLFKDKYCMATTPNR
jgi:hypothetical protein